MRVFLIAVLALLVPGFARADSYDLVIARTPVTVDGKSHTALTINGTLPGPTLHFTEGENVTLRVTNALDTLTSLHWHGFILPAEMDGVPGFNGFAGIKPGSTFTYRFKVRQSGTYWYHSHVGTQEQGGLYGPIIVAPKDGDIVKSERDYVVVLSDFTAANPDRILSNLKADSGTYNFHKRTVMDFFRDVTHEGAGTAMRDRLAWGGMRMDPTDLADVSGYTFLINGKSAADNWTGLFKPGEKVRLRLVNASSMTYFDVRIPGLKMIVIQADGQDVQPVPVDEMRIAVAETYDVIVVPRTDKAYTIMAESMDRSGYVRGTLAPRSGMEGAIPPRRPRTLLTMADMGMEGMDMSGGDMSGGDMPGMNMGGMAMPGMDMGTHQGHDMTPPDETGPHGWADASTPKGLRMLSYKDLRALTPQKDTRAPAREIVVRLGGNMERYIWTLNGKSYADAEPIALKYGERVKLTFVNETMMAHPMHLHGMFFQLVNGQPAERLPNKHVVNVPPGQSYSVLITADAPGEWAFHCHLLYHMETGMMRKVVVARLAADAGTAKSGG